MDVSSTASKRRRTDSELGTISPADSDKDITPHPDFWFQDGSIILMCDPFGFRLHPSILSLHSTVFRDMFSVGSPSGDETYDGCTVLRLQDDADDMYQTLKMLYFRTYGQNKKTFTLTTISGILRICTKYMIDGLRQEIVDYLTFVFPSTIETYRSTLRRTALPVNFNPVVGVEISHEFDLPIILPGALYQSALLGVDAILNGVPQHGGLRAQVSQRVQREILLFRHMLEESMDDDIGTATMFDDDPIECPRKLDDCMGCQAWILRIMWTTYRHLRMDIFITTSDEHGGLLEDVCDACIADRDTKERNVYQPRIWNYLPVFVPDKEWVSWRDVLAEQKTLEDKPGEMT